MYMNTNNRYAIRYTCPANLTQIHFGSKKTKIWACSTSIPFELRGSFEYAVLFLDIDSCYKYIKQHDMTDVEVVDVVVQVPE